jgi:hypothetical protein
MPVQAEQIKFEEEQSFRQTWVRWLITGGLVLVVGTAGLLIFGMIRQPAHANEALIPLAIVVFIQGGAMWLIYAMKLSVRVEDRHLHIRYFPLVKRDIPLEEIAHCEARTYRPLLEYGGWGIRCSWKGMAYNVSGNRGVQLKFMNGKRLLIGSQRADELAAAITQAKGQG